MFNTLSNYPVKHLPHRTCVDEAELHMRQGRESICLYRQLHPVYPWSWTQLGMEIYGYWKFLSMWGPRSWTKDSDWPTHTAWNKGWPCSCFHREYLSVCLLCMNLSSKGRGRASSADMATSPLQSLPSGASDALCWASVCHACIGCMHLCDVWYALL